MTTKIRKSIDIQKQAAREILAQAAYYEEETLNDRLSLRWGRAVTETIESLVRNSERGKLCLFNAPRLKGMRRIPVNGFPNHAIYYLVTPKEPEIRIVRVVHGARDLETVFG